MVLLFEIKQLSCHDLYFLKTSTDFCFTVCDWWLTDVWEIKAVSFLLTSHRCLLVDAQLLSLSVTVQIKKDDHVSRWWIHCWSTIWPLHHRTEVQKCCLQLYRYLLLHVFQFEKILVVKYVPVFFLFCFTVTILNVASNHNSRKSLKIEDLMLDQTEVINVIHVL